MAKASVTNTSDSEFRLIRATERLLAEHGFMGVSLRQIIKAAGHRNLSAVHYHFGSREGLVKAVFLHRMASINPRRLAILAQLAQESRLTDVRALVGVWVWPLAEVLNNQAGECFYLRFLERFLRDPSLISTQPDRRAWLSGWDKTNDKLTQALNHLPSKMIKLRLQLATNQCISGLATIETLAKRSADRLAMVEVLIDALVAGLVSPPSQEALRALKPGSSANRKDAST